jgi:meso-butanediol dehydrogenase / (S,S)-butanediol dehydrogenase / diacetyl reductase
VTSVRPGVISTPLVRKQLKGPGGNNANAMIELSASLRVGTAEDVASVVAFLAGPESSFITGNDILVGGGAVSARR